MYRACLGCGHEIRVGEVTDPLIVNDVLSLAESTQVTSLERFKLRVVNSLAQTKDLLVDVGSSSGKFLYYAKNSFKEHVGLEITPASIAFSRDVLGLTISPTLDSLAGKKASVITFWHSLEHIPPEVLVTMLSALKAASTSATRVVIAVPNAGSTLYHLLKKRFTYHDQASHIHQFSRNSLDQLMAEHGFLPGGQYFSFAYSFFGYLQSLLNLGNLRLNFLYFYLKRGQSFGYTKPQTWALLAYNCLLAAICLVPALLGTVYDRLCMNKAVVLTVWYQPKNSIS